MQKILVFIAVIIINTPLYLHAQSISELRTKIEGNRTKVQQIEAEIKKYERELQTVQGKKRTLQNTVRELDISRKQTTAKIQLTENRIKQTKKTLSTLAEQITDTLMSIKKSTQGLAQAIRRMHEREERSFIEILLLNENLASSWSAIESLRQFQSVISGHVQTLNKEKQRLESIKNKTEEKKRELSAEKEELASQKKTLDITRNTKNTLLKQTKNKESEYQKILAAKRQAKKEFEAQMAKFEAQLKFILDKNSIPQKGSKIFTWPVPSRYVTQYFGNTAFAKSGAYNGRGHNGMDIRASIGTRVNAVLDGVVQDTNEKVAKNCQYGKWVLIKHNNGLTTLYAHLSDISVKKGQNVVTGQRIGYSGNTGYAFGPHLHLTTYASKAVKFKQYKCKSTGTVVKVPISAYSGYLNPIDYF